MFRDLSIHIVSRWIVMHWYLPLTCYSCFPWLFAFGVIRRVVYYAPSNLESVHRTFITTCNPNRTCHKVCQFTVTHCLFCTGHCPVTLERISQMCRHILSHLELHIREPPKRLHSSGTVSCSSSVAFFFPASVTLGLCCALYGLISICENHPKTNTHALYPAATLTGSFFRSPLD